MAVSRRLEVPPRVEYELTELGVSVSEPIASLRAWAEDNVDRIEALNGGWLRSS